MATVEELEAKLQEADEQIKALEKDRDTWKKSSRSHEDNNKSLVTELSEVKASARELQVKEVARKAGIPEGLASRLQGENIEELEADAKIIAESLGQINKNEDSVSDNDTIVEEKKKMAPVPEQGLTSEITSKGKISSAEDFEALFNSKFNR